MDKKALAQEILTLVGGKENINSVVHCATRLRFSLKDESKAKTKEIQENQDVIQVVQSGGQYQIVIGSQVGDVYQELTEILGDQTSEDSATDQNLFNRLIDIISSIFTPFLGAMAGSGVLKGFLILFTTLGWLSDKSGTYQILFAAADGIFMFLPILLAFTAAKKFKVNPYIASMTAFALMHPSMVALAGQPPVKFLGMPVIMPLAGYGSTVIPMILSVWIQSYVEKFIKKVVPDFIKIIMVPLLVALIMVPLTFIAIGPIGTLIGDVLSKGYTSVYNFSPVVAGIVMGGFWQVFVMFGMHWGFIPIGMINLSLLKYDTMVPMLLPAVIAQGGAALAVFLRTKNSKRKALAFSSAITSLFGITEPTVYGVTLPLKKPFIAACIGGAVGGGIVAFSGTKAFAMGIVSLLSIPTFISPIEGIVSNVTGAIIGTLVAFLLSFILTLVLGFDVEAPKETKETSSTSDAHLSKEGVAKETLVSPLTGKVKMLSDIADPVFSSGAMGKGIAIEPTIGELRSPVAGTVEIAFPTGHAVGLKSTSGIEILLHIGMDTVELEGQGFELHVKKGDQVQPGDLLVTFDLEQIKQAGKPTITPIVITNSGDYLDVLDLNQQEVVTGEAFLTVVK